MFIDYPLNNYSPGPVPEPILPDIVFCEPLIGSLVIVPCPLYLSLQLTLSYFSLILPLTNLSRICIPDPPENHLIVAIALGHFFEVNHEIRDLKYVLRVSRFIRLIGYQAIIVYDAPKIGMIAVFIVCCGLVLPKASEILKLVQVLRSKQHYKIV